MFSSHLLVYNSPYLLLYKQQCTFALYLYKTRINTSLHEKISHIYKRNNKKCSTAAGEKDFKNTTIQKPQFLSILVNIPIYVQQKYGTILFILIAWIHEYVIKGTTVMTE